MRNVLLARAAENLFWLGRYLERAENLARILEVNATFDRDIQGMQNWLPVLRLHRDEARFLATHDAASADAVLYFYILDRENPTSIVSAITNARSNARALRPLISREMWSQLNVLFNWISTLDRQVLSPGRLTRLLAEIEEACQTHTGITEGTFHRDQGWAFYWIGRYIERADQTTRLLDIKSHFLQSRSSDETSSMDLAHWNALLRSAAAYHPYRRVRSAAVTPEGIAGFLLLDQGLPRSVLLCTHEVDRLLAELRLHYVLSAGETAADEVRALRAELRDLAGRELLGDGLHELLDLVQRRLIAVTKHLSAEFFFLPAKTTLPQAQRAD
ncbi:MAG TPA: alpha-E domain-containing protein [Microvirga sp.]